MDIKLEEERLIEEEKMIAERERKQFIKMTQTPMAKLIIGLGIPTTLSMMVTSLYNLADTYFVSMLGNDAVTAAVGNLLALMSIIQAIGFTYGMGCGSLISRLLGKRDRAGADRVASSSFAIALASGLIVLIVGLLFLSPLMKLFGSKSAEVLTYAKQYGVFVLISAPFMCMSFVMNNALRAEGKAVLSMIGLVSGAVLNVALDPLLIFGLKMGVRGAAIATCFSQIVSWCILLFMFLSGKTIVRLKPRSVDRTFATYGEVISTGFPSFCRQILASLCTVFLNNAAYAYGGDAAQASFAVVQKVFMLAFSLSLGIGQGYQPVLGYNYSAKRFDRVKKAYLFTLTFAVSVMIVFGSVCAIFADGVMRMFSLSKDATSIGTLTLRLQCVCMPLLPVNFMISITYQTVGNKAIASVLSVARQGLFYIPAVMILPRFFALLGVQACQSVSDVLSFLFSIPFTVIFLRSVERQRKEMGEGGNEAITSVTIDESDYMME